MRVVAGRDSYRASTATGIVTAMRQTYNGWHPSGKLDSNEKYIDCVIEQLKNEGVEVVCSGTTMEEKCSSFIQALVDEHVVRQVAG